MEFVINKSSSEFESRLELFGNTYNLSERRLVAESIWMVLTLAVLGLYSSAAFAGFLVISSVFPLGISHMTAIECSIVVGGVGLLYSMGFLQLNTLAAKTDYS